MTEILLDTNLLLRFFLRDIPEQNKKASRLMARIEAGEARASISLLVVNELLWIGEHFYELSRDFVTQALIEVLRYTHIRIEEVRKQRVIQALHRYQQVSSKIDITDVYLAMIAEGRTIASFDKDLKKLGAVVAEL